MNLLVGKKSVAVILVMTMFFSTMVSFMSYNSRNNVVTAATTDSAFETAIADFPDSYKPYLRILHEEHPNWTFEAVNTGLKWSDVVAGESNYNHDTRNLVPYNTMYLASSSSVFPVPPSWLASTATNDDGTYNIASDPYWVNCSDAVLKYYLDPRNFLNDTYIFDFEQLAYNNSLDYNTILKSMLDNTFMDCDYATVGGSGGKTYAEVFIEVGKANNISPIMIASRIRQEKGTGIVSSSGKYVINDTLGAGVTSGGKTYYNFFNIGASGTTSADIIANGLAEAKTNGWTSQYLAIVGGGKFLKSGFYDIGQDTLYFQKFSVVDSKYLYWKQYMQNLVAPVNESYSTMIAYTNAGILESAYHFRIPVYLNMPSTAVNMPTTGYDSSYTLSNLTTNVNGVAYSLEQTFAKSRLQYNVVVPKGTTGVSVVATRTNSAAKVYINGTLITSSTNTLTSKVAVSSGVNRIPIKVIGKTGTWTYFLNIFVSDSTTTKDINYLSAISLTGVSLSPTFAKTTLDYTASVSNSVSSIKLNITPATNAWPTIYYKDRTEANTFANVTSITHSLSVGTNVFYVDVTSANGGLRTYTITVTRAAAAVTTPTEEETTEQETTTATMTYTFKTYNVVTSGSTQYVNGFTVGTTVKTALSNFTIKNGSAKVTDSSGTTKDSSSTLATGDIIVLTGTDKTTVKLNVIIYGDVNGDGVIDLFDYAYLKKDYWGGVALKGTFAKAGNVYSSSSGIDIFDLATMKKYVWGGGTITQSRK